MPATLTHLGIQTVCSKTLFKNPDLKWIGLGCMVPDLPWILQRIIPNILVDIDRYDLRLYCMVQASLFFCLIPTAAISLQVKQRWSLFMLLACNCGFHLLLDATQIKWGNGAHLFAPFSWQLVSWNLFWPEDTISYLLMAGGLVVFLFFAYRERERRIALVTSKQTLLGGSGLLLFYLAGPFLFMSGPLEANNHFIATLSNPASRTGKTIELDRCSYDALTNSVTLFSNEEIHLNALSLPPSSGTVSVKGIFSEPGVIAVDQIHLHHSGYRDMGVLLGLLLILLVWFIAIVHKQITVEKI